MSETQLELLARPFPRKYVKSPPKGKYGSYVPHHIVTQALLMIVGPYSFHIDQWLTGADGTIEGCVAELRVTVDGELVTVQEVGECEVPTNWKTQGARAKDAASDAFKRCAMRLGLGLHLWAEPDYFLYEQLSKRSGAGDGGAESASPTTPLLKGEPHPYVQPRRSPMVGERKQ